MFKEKLRSGITISMFVIIVLNALATADEFVNLTNDNKISGEFKKSTENKLSRKRCANPQLIILKYGKGIRK